MILTLWILSGIASCAIFTHNERRYIRGMDIADACFLLLIYACIMILGPYGLAGLSLASFMVWLVNR